MFFTVGASEARAWNIPRGATAVEAAGVIHTDFAKAFVKAEVSLLLSNNKQQHVFLFNNMS